MVTSGRSTQVTTCNECSDNTQPARAPRKFTSARWQRTCCASASPSPPYKHTHHQSFPSSSLAPGGSVRAARAPPPRRPPRAATAAPPAALVPPPAAPLGSTEHRPPLPERPAAGPAQDGIPAGPGAELARYRTAWTAGPARTAGGCRWGPGQMRGRRRRRQPWGPEEGWIGGGATSLLTECGGGGCKCAVKATEGVQGRLHLYSHSC